jgi:hypothetical protein
VADKYRLWAFLQEHGVGLTWDGGTGFTPSVPKYDLYPLDYLGYARDELVRQQAAGEPKTNARHTINCVAHLKRAIDCQLDLFYEGYGLLRHVRERNLGFDRKLTFVRAAIGLHSDALRRLAQLRNAMEHDFSLPSVADLEAHSDLVSLFVAMLQQAISFASWFEGDYVTNQDSPHGAFLSVDYDRELPLIGLEWGIDRKENELKADINRPELFAYFFRVNYLLYHKRLFGREESVIGMLEPGSIDVSGTGDM